MGEVITSSPPSVQLDANITKDFREHLEQLTTVVTKRLHEQFEDIVITTQSGLTDTGAPPMTAATIQFPTILKAGEGITFPDEWTGWESFFSHSRRVVKKLHEDVAILPNSMVLPAEMGERFVWALNAAEAASLFLNGYDTVTREIFDAYTSFDIALDDLFNLLEEKAPPGHTVN